MTSKTVPPSLALFDDWCRVKGHQPLPTTATVIAEYLREVPAARSTMAKRVQAIQRH